MKTDFDKITLLAQEKLQITLALSLHAVTQEKREKLMPIAKRYPMDRLLEACREYFQVTGRRVTLEYSLVKGENDSPEDAALLGQIASGMHCLTEPSREIMQHTFSGIRKQGHTAEPSESTRAR